MDIDLIRAAGCALVLSLGAVPSWAQAPDPPPLNTLRGIVVAQSDGRPLAGVPVVMVHAARGHVRIGPKYLAGWGDQDEATPDDGTFARRNNRLFCDALTADDGTFVLRNFGAPEERWHIAAGDRTRGYCLRLNIVPTEFRDASLRIVIDEPAYLTTQHLPEPPGDFRASVAFALVDPTPAAAPTTQSTDPNDGLAAHVMLYAWPDDHENPVWRMGPLPPGYTYRVTHELWSPTLRYDVTLFQRQVELAAGTVTPIKLTPDPGTTLSGRLTDTKGQALANVNVLLRTTDAVGTVLGALSDADGRYALANAPPGTHTLELLRHATPTAPT